MNERPGRTDAHAQLNHELQRCLDALLSGKCNEAEFVESVRGNCSESEFIDAILVQLRAVPDSRPKIMAVLNRMQSRGEVTPDLVHFLESKIAAERSPNSNDQTVDLARIGTSCVVFGGPPPSPVEIGRVLRDRYVIEKRLGSGGRGTVFKALDRFRSSLPASQQHVAIKILHAVPHARDAMIDSLQRELYCAQMLSHGNIVNVFELDRDGDIDFFTMELLEGELLSSVMARFAARPMHRPHAWAIIRQIASGLEHAHGRDVVHADLKPQNIMITESGEVRILDFGSSSIFSKPPALNGRELGSRSATAAYASCEILAGRTADRRDDLYSLACICYELLTGTHPFLRRRANEARDLGIIAARPSGLSRRQWQTLAKGLSSHRAGRSITVSEWFKRLNPDNTEVQRLPNSKELLPSLPSAPLASSFKASAVLTLLAVTVVGSILFLRLAPGGRVSGDTASVAASVGRAEEPFASSSSFEPGVRDSITNSPLTRATESPVFGKTISDGSRTKLLSQMNHPLAVSASDYEARPGERFAEIRVHRSPALRGDVPFVWWTEAASAKPGVDYVQQTKVTQSFPKGKNSTSFFVKLLPKASRHRPEVFYVAIGDAAGGPSLGQIAHTAVWLPSSQPADALGTPEIANVVKSTAGTN